MPTPEICHEPCSDDLFEGIGEGFVTGTVGGSAFHFFKGIYNSPKGRRFIGSTQAVRTNGFRLGGVLAVWYGLSSILKCSIEHVRQKEDPWNCMFGCAAAAGSLQMRKGLGPASRWTLFAGVLGLLEGASDYIELESPQLDSKLPRFGGGEIEKKEVDEKKSGGIKTILESFKLK
ncbi:Mitochondrial import inner membrane translocase subunit TIM17-2 [Abeliophyllum distichum]|uniref:Mitochondrial import inner membrane translocase subunit TIM17-2 n=1 Tax=Abeliophyllum distichum TaxID=126358 RepID=A0ABD1TFF0_9LAMI